jgi:hypothetical protein
MIELALNPETTAKLLGAMVGQFHNVDALIAKHPNALLWVFEYLASNGMETDETTFTNQIHSCSST